MTSSTPLLDGADVAGIAAGLSRAQRQAVLLYYERWSIDKLGITASTSNALIRKDIWTGRPYEPRWTELGLAVRSHLQTMEGMDDGQ